MLIESFLMNIPVPPVYLSEDDFGRYSVIDGKQRITAIHEYMRGKFALSMLVRFPELNGYKFAQLPQQLRNALLVRPYIRAVTLLRQSDLQTKYEVFHRLNSGGEPLNAQEIRNVLYRGPLNDLLVQLSAAPFLRRQLKIRDTKSHAYRAMTDIEFVLRYLTLKETWQNFSGDFRWSMDLYMEVHQSPGDDELSAIGAQFNRALGTCENLWGVHAFKRPEKDGWRDQALAGMYDTQMVAASLLSDDEIRVLSAAKDELVHATRQLFLDDEEFDAAVRVATNTPTRVRYRIGRLLDTMRELAR